MGLVLVNAVHRQAVELKQHSHPFRVALGQIVIHRHHVHTLAWQGVQVYRQGGHKGLALAGGHLGNFAAVQHHAANQLHVVVHHVPCNHVAAGHPMVLVNGFVLPVVAGYDAHAVALHGQRAVVVGGGHHHLLVLGKAACRLFHHAEGFGQYVVQHFLRLVIRLLLKFVYLLVYLLLLGHGHVIFLLDAQPQGAQLLLLGLHLFANALLELYGLGTQLVVSQFLNLGINLQCGIEERFHLF